MARNVVQFQHHFVKGWNLMVRAAVFKLCSSEIVNSFSCPCRYLMNESYEILIGIPKSHFPANARLKERGGRDMYNVWTMHW